MYLLFASHLIAGPIKGKVFFTTTASPAAIVQLKSAENLYVVAEMQPFEPPTAADLVEETLLKMKAHVRDELEVMGALGTWLAFRRMQCGMLLFSDNKLSLSLSLSAL